MSAITSLDALIEAQTDGTEQHLDFFIDNRIDQSPAVNLPNVGYGISLWRFNKTNGQNADLPATVLACDRTTKGAFAQVNATSGKQLWLIGMEAMANVGGTYTVYDRLLEKGTLSGSSALSQTVGGTITRNTGGEGNEIWIEINTQIGTTATTLAVTYTNQAGAGSRVTPLIAIGNTNNREAGRLLRCPLAAGDTGVQSVQSVQLTATTGTQGDFAVIIAKPIAKGFIEAQGSQSYRNLLAFGAAMPIPDDACLALAWVGAGSNAPKIEFTVHFVEV